MNPHIEPRPKPRGRSRRDRAGNWWCLACHRHLPPARYHHVDRGRGPQPIAECRACTRRRDVVRYNRMAINESAYRAHLRKNERIRSRQRHEIQADRREFAQLVIRRLRAKGLTVGEIARLCGAKPVTIRGWARGDTRVQHHSARRLGIVFRAALDVTPVLPDPRSRNHKAHHPDFWHLMAVTREQIERVMR